MDDTEKARLRAQKMTAMQGMALTVLLARNGGTVTFSKAEFLSVVEQYGGDVNMSIHIEGLGPKTGRGKVDEIRAILVRRPPKQGDLLS